MAGVPSSLLKALNMMQDLTCNVQQYRQLMVHAHNSETLLATVWRHTGVSVSRGPRTMFTVRAECDPTVGGGR